MSYQMFVTSDLIIKISHTKMEKSNSPIPSYDSYFHSNGFSTKDLEVKILELCHLLIGQFTLALCGLVSSSVKWSS